MEICDRKMSILKLRHCGGLRRKLSLQVAAAAAATPHSAPAEKLCPRSFKMFFWSCYLGKWDKKSDKFKIVGMKNIRAVSKKAEDSSTSKWSIHIILSN